MNRFVRRAIAAILLLPALPWAAAGAQPDRKQPDTYTNRYEIRFLDLHAAELLAWEQCTVKEICRVTVLETPPPEKGSAKTYLEVWADATTHERIARALAREDAAPRTRTFQVVLLLADNKPGSPAQNLPAGAQKALEDVRGLLPFKSYHVLDTAWLRTTRSVNGRLMGRQQEDYVVDLWFRNAGGAEGKSLFVSDFQLREEGSRATPDGKQRGPRLLLRTSFGLEVGETIVVGTSKLDSGEEALVVLVTAVS